MLAATLIAVGAFVLYRVGADAWGDALLSEHFTAALIGSSSVLAVVLYRRFDR